MSRLGYCPRPMNRPSLYVAAAFLSAGLGAQELQMERTAVVPAGGRAVGGGFALDGTLGQPVSGVSSGDIYVLESGFHQRDAVGDALFANGFES